MDPSRLRRHFPVTRRWTFLDHAATSPLPAPAAEAMGRWVRGQRDSAFWDRLDAGGLLRRFRRAAAALLGGGEDEIAIVKNTSEGISFVAEGLAWRRGDEAVTGAAEYPANVYPWMNQRRRGVRLRLVREEGGRIPVPAIRRAMTPRTRLLAVSFVQFVSGYRSDIARLARLCRGRGARLCVDAIQGLGALRFRARRWGADFVACGSQKWLLGPPGVGILWVRRSRLGEVHPVEVGAQSVRDPLDWLRYDLSFPRTARRFEPGTENLAGIAGLLASMEMLLGIGIDRIERRVLALTDLLCREASRRGWTVASPRGPGEASGIVSIRRRGLAAPAAARALRAKRILVSPRGGTLRASPHVYNTEAEIRRLLRALG